jgi:outer membrane receptor protein involved in Fe transport
MLCAVLVGAIIPTRGQVNTGEIRIEVNDPSGNPMQAEGKLQGLAGGIDLRFSTDIQGKYNFKKLPYGRYRLELTRDGCAPTSVELGCADLQNPCKLPNALAGDPPLKQVVARTWEAGVRGLDDGPVTWSFAAFRDDNRNDILFVTSEQTSFGYFKNFGKTRRQGVEIDARSRASRFTFGAGYTLLDATYQSGETVNGFSNSRNETAEAGIRGVPGSLEIEPGDRIPLTPRHMVKAFTDIQVTSKWNPRFGNDRLFQLLRAWK